jgi:hypothetical protein
MTCQERIDCIKLFAPVGFAVISVVAVGVIILADLQAYKDYVEGLLGFAFINLGVSK